MRAGLLAGALVVFALPAGAVSPGAVFRDCPNCPEMVVIPAGSFEMGSDRFIADDSERPAHTVRISLFALAKAEVTRGQFAAFVAETNYSVINGCYVTDGQGRWIDDSKRSWRDPGFMQTDSHPVTCVSWNDANAYINWLARRTGKKYRLPSEAEYEYAARAGSAHPPSETEAEVCARANVADRIAESKKAIAEKGVAIFYCEDGHGHTAPTMSYSANAFGLHDMIGNVSEWTEDCRYKHAHEFRFGYQSSEYQLLTRDGAALVNGDCFVRQMRGGSWNSDQWDARVIKRSTAISSARNSTFGFRPALTIK